MWAEVSSSAENAEPFLRQLIWRDFAWHRFYHLPNMVTVNVREAFNRFPWEWTPRAKPSSTSRAFAHIEMDVEAQHIGELAAWQSGRTGVPLVDAGMRELWATGSMHNRARMVVGSWLTKNLGIHWRHGVPEALTPLYPEPMVDIAESRKTALAAYKDISG